jgi:hypothetical protein
MKYSMKENDVMLSVEEDYETGMHNAIMKFQKQHNL